MHTPIFWDGNTYLLEGVLIYYYFSEKYLLTVTPGKMTIIIHDIIKIVVAIVLFCKSMNW